MDQYLDEDWMVEYVAAQPEPDVVPCDNCGERYPIETMIEAWVTDENRYFHYCTACRGR